MAIQLPTLEEIKSITRQSLKNNFPLFREEHKIDEYPLNEGRDLWIGYRTKWNSGLDIINSTHFDLNVQDGTFYLVGINLDREERGKGLGWKLYQTSFNIAQRIGFSFVRQTPSGGFFRNGKMVESRRDYLLKKGCVPAPGTQVDWVIN